MKKFISTALAVVMLISALPATAATWITLSSWAYNDVSNFKKEGLIPETLEDADDYTVNITRVQFAELLYSALKNAGVIQKRGRNPFLDTTSEAAIVLEYNNIMLGCGEENDNDGVKTYFTGGKDEKEYFYPDRELTREEMATVLYRAAVYYCGDKVDSDDNPQRTVEDFTDKPADFDEISDWAQMGILKLLSAGFLNGTGDGRFMPKGNVTIEQAVVAIYRVYNNIPDDFGADGADIDAKDETLIQTYSNGLTETKKGNVLYLKDGDNVLMDFETDIYMNIYSITIDGTIYAAAQNGYEKTDVYDIKTQQILFKIPAAVYKLSEDYIYTKSQNNGPMTFGLYDYSGKELLAAEYSLDEIDAIVANGLKIPNDEYKDASGWIYYEDMDDDARLYRIDSNGENKQRITEKSCAGFYYIDGWIYYFSKVGDDKGMYCIKPDGTGEKCIFEPGQLNISFVGNNYDVYDIDIVNYPAVSHDRVIYNGDSRYFYDGNSIYCTVYDADEDFRSLWKINYGDGEVKAERVSGDYYVTRTQVRDGKIYFTDYTARKASEEKYTGSSDEEYDASMPLYRYDNGEINKLSGDLPVLDYGFVDGKLVMEVGTDYDDYTYYLANPDGTETEIWQEAADAEARHDAALENGEKFTRVNTYYYDDLSDEKFTVYSKSTSEYTAVYENGKYTWAHDFKGYELVFRNNETGKETVAVNDSYALGRMGDKLYYAVENDEYNKSAYTIRVCDMNTGETKDAVKDARGMEYINGDDWLIYTDFNLNTCRYDDSTGETSEVFPNANLRRYGKVERMLGTDSGMYKIDTDGNYSFIMDDLAAQCLYVENGKKEGTAF